jgi:hypothetical protein
VRRWAGRCRLAPVDRACFQRLKLKCDGLHSDFGFFISTCAATAGYAHVHGRGLHTSTFRLNLSTFLWDALPGCVASKTKTAQVEKRTSVSPWSTERVVLTATYNGTSAELYSVTNSLAVDLNLTSIDVGSRGIFIKRWYWGLMIGANR